VIRSGAGSVATFLAIAIKKGARNFLFDSETPEDLALIGEASFRFDSQVVYAGSAGFSTYCCHERERETGKKQVQVSERDGLCFVICGTRHLISRSQMAYAAKRSEDSILMLDIRKGNREEALSGLLRDIDRKVADGKRLVYIAVSTLFDEVGDEGEDAASRIALLIGDAVNKIASRYPLKGLFLTGGDTALSVCEALGAVAMVPEVELVAGIPLCVLNDGPHRMLPVITKSGGFGGESAIYDCVSCLGGKNE
jgi:uncharacterized protein YgbK (DUF1537 family)